jgi:PKHD-type hydroxylase
VRPGSKTGPVALPEFVVKRSLFSVEECKELQQMTIGRGRFYRSAADSYARKVDISYLQAATLPWVTRRLEQVARTANIWKLRLSRIEHPMRIQRYRRNDYNDTHSDYEYAEGEYTKVTIVAPLVCRSEWTGGDLEIGNAYRAPRIDQGDAVLFPSFVLHRVTKVTAGQRLILSAWVSGPPLT